MIRKKYKKPKKSLSNSKSNYKEFLLCSYFLFKLPLISVVVRLLEFKREKLSEMSNEKKRRRLTIAELYASDVDVIATLVEGTAQSYKIEENIPLKTAQERALSDFQFWYEGNSDRQRQLEEYIFNEN